MKSEWKDKITETAHLTKGWDKIIFTFKLLYLHYQSIYLAARRICGLFLMSTIHYLLVLYNNRSTNWHICNKKNIFCGKYMYLCNKILKRPNKIDSMFYLSSRSDFAQILENLHKPKNFTFFFYTHWSSNKVCVFFQVCAAFYAGAHSFSKNPWGKR